MDWFERTMAQMCEHIPFSDIAVKFVTPSDMLMVKKLKWNMLLT